MVNTLTIQYPPVFLLPSTQFPCASCGRGFRQRSAALAAHCSGGGPWATLAFSISPGGNPANYDGSTNHVGGALLSLGSLGRFPATRSLGPHASFEADLRCGGLDARRSKAASLASHGSLHPASKAKGVWTNRIVVVGHGAGLRALSNRMLPSSQRAGAVLERPFDSGASHRRRHSDSLDYQQPVIGIVPLGAPIKSMS